LAEVVVGGEDLYSLLEIEPEATSEDITRAYRRAARNYHPDTNPDDPVAQQRFVLIHAAYEVLHDPAKRKAYDATRSSARGKRGGVGESSEEDWSGMMGELIRHAKSAFSSSSSARPPQGSVGGFAEGEWSEVMGELIRQAKSAFASAADSGKATATIDRAALLTGSGIGDRIRSFGGGKIRCRVRTDSIELQTKFGSVSLSMSQIVNLWVHPPDRPFGAREVEATLTDGSVFRGAFVTKSLELEFGEGVAASSSVPMESIGSIEGVAST